LPEYVKAEIIDFPKNALFLLKIRKNHQALKALPPVPLVSSGIRLFPGPIAGVFAPRPPALASGGWALVPRPSN